MNDQDERTGSGARRAMPGWEAAIRHKHEMQIAMHVAQFGPLGQIMTPTHRKRLRSAIKRTGS